jgi:hypothetical protein
MSMYGGLLRRETWAVIGAGVVGRGVDVVPLDRRLTVFW